MKTERKHTSGNINSLMRFHQKSPYFAGSGRKVHKFYTPMQNSESQRKRGWIPLALNSIKMSSLLTLPDD